jgi:CO/xanthine dehydrogenase Mo-binding subunit
VDVRDDPPDRRLCVVAGEVGGSFGMKGGHYPEYAMALWASRKIGRPVKWIAERGEGMLADDHDRDYVSEAELALDRDGHFLALRARNISNIGAYLAPGGIISPTMHLGGLAGTYMTPAIYVEVSAVFTNTTSIGPYRGSGRPEASYIVERLIDTAAHEVGIDPETGKTEVLRYVVVDDVGTDINKLTLEGQIHGGVAQGIGQAFTEHLVYDRHSGQLLTGSLMDYGLPRADEVCSFEMYENPVPTKTNPLGVKGAGEAGNVGALAAIMNAVIDALGVTHIDMPATPEKVWNAIRAVQGR